MLISYRPILLFAILVASTVLAEDVQEIEKKEYNDEGSYAQIFENPKDYLRKRLILRIVFQNVVQKLPKPYDDILPAYFSMINIENAKLIPFVYSEKDDALRKRFSELAPNKLIKVYGVLLSKTYNKKGGAALANVDGKKCYYFEIEDIGQITTDNKEPKQLLPNLSDYSYVEFRRLDIQYAKYLEKKINFNVSFRDIDNNIPIHLIKLSNINTDTHFQIYVSEPFHTSIIVNRNNENCVKTIVNAKTNSKITIYGLLKNVSDPAQKDEKPQYYIEAHMIDDFEE